MTDENFWNDPKKAQSIIQETNINREMISTYKKLSDGFKDIELSLNEIKDTFDEELKILIEEEYESLIKNSMNLRLEFY